MSDINTTINSFLNDTRLQEVKNYHIDTFEKVYQLETDLLALSDKVDNLDLSGYLPVTGSTDNTIDFTLTRKGLNLKAKTNITLGADTGDPYFSINTGQLDVNVMGAIHLIAPGEIKLQSASSNGASVGLYSQALQYTSSTAYFYAGPAHIVYSTSSSSSTPSSLRMDNSSFTLRDLGNAAVTISDTTYSGISNNYSIFLNSSSALISSGVKSNNVYPNEFGFSSTVFYIKSENQTVLRSHNYEFLAQGYSNNTLAFKLAANSAALNYYIGNTQLLNITSSIFDILGRISSASGDITLNAAENKKAYYVKNNATPTANDEIATKGDLANIDLSNYVTTTQYNELLTAYNDLAERLNEFLMNTGEVEEGPSLPTLTDELITVPTNHVSITLNANNFYLDWGDGSEVETITGNNSVTKTHDYAETKVWKIKIGPNDENATGEIDAYRHEDETGTNPNQFTEVNLNHLIYNINDYQNYEDTANSTTITKYRINYPTTHSGCGFAFLINCPNLTEVYFGPLTEGISMGPIEISENLDSNLTSIYLDLDTEVFETSPYFMFYRQSLTDIYFYNETPISLLYNEEQTYLTDEEFSANESGEAIDVSGLTIHVPSAAVEAYKAAPGWSIYADRIVGDI